MLYTDDDLNKINNNTGGLCPVKYERIYFFLSVLGNTRKRHNS